MPVGLRAAEGWIDVWLTSTRLAEEQVSAYGASLSGSERARAEKMALAGWPPQAVVAAAWRPLTPRSFSIVRSGHPR